VLAENDGHWESASPRDLARVDALARAVMSRLLHEPTLRLRSLSEARGHASLELVRELFGLRDGLTEASREPDPGETPDNVRTLPRRTSAGGSGSP
jgi:glutamyl-tRNA reductase